MSGNDRHMEELFRARMESFRVDPSPGIWEKVSARIFWKQFMTFRFRTFNVYYLAAAISLAGIGTYAFFSHHDRGERDHALPVRVENEILPVPPVLADPLSERTDTDLEPAERSETEPGINKPYREKEIHATEEGKKSKPDVSLNQEDSPEKQTISSSEPESPEKTGKKSGSLLVSAGFDASILSGCSPLAIRFENLSVNAVRSNWTFGDGGSSAEENPSYVFDEPGEYTVMLEILGADGLEYTTQQTIRVFETPKALFEMDEEVDLSAGQPVYFYNYSRGADYYEWDFGDKQRSSLEEPIHLYDNPGSYDVKLKVWTENRCYDSLIVLNAFTGTENMIRFPNAFTPNLTGPTGGYYDLNDVHNTVFHPVVTGELAEYQLKIFNRQGLLIFESKDVNIGWDGYYQEKLAAQAVYIWKARGKFSNGKTFVKSGDVTLIRRW